MRIISGKMRGTKLYTLEGLNTRPTMDRVKESLFNIINTKIENSIVLDLFSGSGALALEALSRGAKEAVLCDSSREAIHVIQKNIQKTRTEEETVVLHCHYEKALQELKMQQKRFDIILLDPPYATNAVEKAIEQIIRNQLLQDNGIIVVETDNKEKIIEHLNHQLVDIYDIRKYGRVFLLFLNRKG